MEKVSEEVKLMEEMVEFMEKISVRNFEKLTNDDRKALSVARNNVNGVHREMSAVILSSSLAVDVSLIVKDYRSKVEKELNDICSKVSNITIKVDVKDYVDSFQHDYDFCIDDDVGEINPYLEKKKKLILEYDDYEQTLLFLDRLKVIAGKEQISHKDLSVLFHAYNMIMEVYCRLYKTINSVDSSSVWDIDVSLTINESRSKVQNELNYMCNNMSNLTIKEAVSRHLVGFKAGHLPKKLLPRILTDRKRESSQSEMTTTKKKLKLGLVDVEFRSDAEIDFGYHYHSKRIKKQEDAYSQINAIFRDCNHEHVGKGNEIQHASTADDISEDDFFGDWEPELVGKGIDVPNVYTVDDSSEDEYDSCTEMSDGIFSF